LYQSIQAKQANVDVFNFRERKKQKDREDAWAKIESLASQNAEKAAIPVQISPSRNHVKSSHFV
jgi:hypothetical protein